MSAERGWISGPQPEKEWHTPGWLAEKGTGRSHFLTHRRSTRLPREAPWGGFEVSTDNLDDRDAMDGGK